MAKRIVEMDIARGLAATAVVVIHVALGAYCHGDSGATCLRLALYVTARFAVPVFVMLSGMGLTLSHGPGNGYFRWLRRRVGKIAFGYLMWTVIYTLFVDKPTGSIVKPHAVALATLAKNVTTGGSCCHLYFIPRIIGLYALYPLIGKWLRAGRGVAATFVLAAALTPLFRCLDSRPDLWILSLLSGPLRWVPYLAVGVWMASWDGLATLKEPRGKRLALGALLLSLGAIIPVAHSALDPKTGMAGAFPVLKILVAPYAIILIAWIWSRDWPSRRVVAPIEFVSKYSYGIYLSHPFVLAAFCQAVAGAQWMRGCPTVLYLTIAFLFAMGGSIAISMSGAYLRSRATA